MWPHLQTMGSTCVKDLDSNLRARRSTNYRELSLPPHIEETGDNGVSDICGSKDTKFIIQSGARFLQLDSLNDFYGCAIPLGSRCKNGDHYFAQYDIEYNSGPTMRPPNEKTKFFVIKGNSCIEVNNLVTEGGANNIITLHRECQGGSHYLANRSGFYIIRNRDNTYLHVDDMSEYGYNPKRAHCHKLHESYANGLYYFATDDYFYVVKQNADFGLVYHRTKALSLKTETTAVLPVNPSVAHFLQPPNEGITSSCT